MPIDSTSGMYEYAETDAIGTTFSSFLNKLATPLKTVMTSVLSRLTALEADTGWITMYATSATMSNSFTAGTAIQYRVIRGTCYLSGELLRTTAPTAGQSPFTLPTAARPRSRVMTTRSTTGGTFDCLIGSDGLVYITSGTARSSTPGYYLSDISYRVS